MKLQYTVDPMSIVVDSTEISLKLAPSRVQTTGLIMKIVFYDNDIIRFHISEENPLHGRIRYEPKDILIPGSIVPKTFRAKKEETKLSIESLSNKNRLVVSFNKFMIEWYVDNELYSVINSKNLFYFEVTREKSVTPTPTTEESADIQNANLPKSTKKIVDYNESGQAIYEDGTVDTGEATSHDDVSEVELNAQGDIQSQPSGESASIENDDDKEDETGYWSEHFDGHTDTKPFGPQSVGLDVTFMSTKGLFGIPEHAMSLMLQPTFNSKFKEPYRLYNMDVCEFEVEKTMALYGSVPFIMSHNAKRTVGFLWFNPTDTYVDIHEQVNQSQTVQWISEAGVVDVFLFSGGSPHSLLKHYSTLTSMPSLPPFFALGYHQSRWNYIDEKDVLTVLSKFEELNFPFDVLWLDIEHTDNKKYFTWDSKNFPNPKTMTERLSDRKYSLVTVVDPHVKKDASYEVYREMESQNMFLKKADNSVFEGWCWPGNSCYPDYLRSDVRDYWSNRFAFDKYTGTTHFTYTWNDMNEPSVFNGPEVTMPRDVIGHSGHEHREWHNVYGYYYHKANVDGQLIRSPHQRPFVLSRAFFTGSQRFSAIWTGDNESSWTHLKSTVPMLLSVGLGGIPFAGADIPGFFKNPSEELAVRWYQLGAWTPLMRAHAHIDTKRREPWTFTPETCNLLRDTVIQRYQYLPYTYSQHYLSSIHGGPVMRPLWFDFAEELELLSEEQAFMFGDAMLVVPVVDEAAKYVKALIPKGQWMNVNDNSMVSGGRSVSFDTPLSHIPVLQRAGSIVPLQMRLRRNSRVMMDDPMTLRIVVDSKNSARGVLFLDSRDGFGYQKGEFSLMEFIFEADKLKCKKIDGNGYPSLNSIERIDIRIGRTPTRITVLEEATGKKWQASFMVDTTTSITTIKKPMVDANTNWELHFEY